VLFDIKILDPAAHKRYTGQSNGVILENLACIVDYIRKVNREKQRANSPTMKLWIRTPLIPDASATPENIAEISRFICSNLSDVMERWELCAFNNACYSKYKKLGLTWSYQDIPLLEQEFVTKLADIAVSIGIADHKLIVTGLVPKGSG
jgi:pyruvate formate lyase activating enzyme